MRALIVDDSRATRVMIKRILTSVGFETAEAEHGQAALDLLETDQAFDVALVDWNMPVMDGLELVKTLRKDRRFASLPLMMVTAEIDQTRMARALMAGADEYVMKPFDAQIITDKLSLLGCLPESIS
jgi:two-component system, chemotaxis family, chemotaxis protein CheY